MMRTLKQEVTMLHRQSQCETQQSEVRSTESLHRGAPVEGRRDGKMTDATTYT